MFSWVDSVASKTVLDLACYKSKLVLTYVLTALELSICSRLLAVD